MSPRSRNRTRTTKRAGSVDGQWAPAGTVFKEGATPGYSKLFGVGAIYALTPCDEKAALKAVEEIQPRPLMLVSLPTEKALAAPGTRTDYEQDLCPVCHETVETCQCGENGDEDEDGAL